MENPTQRNWRERRIVLVSSSMTVGSHRKHDIEKTKLHFYYLTKLKRQHGLVLLSHLRISRVHFYGVRASRARRTNVIPAPDEFGRECQHSRVIVDPAVD